MEGIAAMNNEHFENQLLAAFTSVCLPQDNELYPIEREALQKLHSQLPLRHGGTHEEQLNRAALGSIGGTDDMLKLFMHTQKATPHCSREARMKDLSIKTCLLHEAEDPQLEYDLALREPCTTCTPRLSEIIYDDETSRNEIAIFMLGTMYHTTPGDATPQHLGHLTLSWKLAQLSERLVGWHMLFFRTKPAFC